MAVLLQFKLILNYDLTIHLRLTPVQMYNIVPPPPLQNSSIENNTFDLVPQDILHEQQHNKQFRY